jgi:hypothetical protein
MRIVFGLAGIALAGVLAPAAAAAPQHYAGALQAYQAAVDRICQTGVTPEMERLYAELVRALEAAGYGAGRGSNFGGPRTPEQAFLECVQSPSDRF